MINIGAFENILNYVSLFLFFLFNMQHCTAQYDTILPNSHTFEGNWQK